MSKPFYISWETYAKRLEKDVKRLERELLSKDFFKLDKDYLINKQLQFPNRDTLSWYLEKRAEVNTHFIASVIRSGDNVQPTTLPYHITSLQTELNHHRKYLQGLLKESKIITKRVKESNENNRI
jgi:hypothetical protein